MNENLIVVYKYADGSTRVVQGNMYRIKHAGTKQIGTSMRAISVKVWNYMMTADSFNYLSEHFHYSLHPYSRTEPEYTQNNPDLYLGSFLGSNLFNPKD